jgi:hypothetical protein
LKKAEHLKIKDVHDDEVVLVTIVRRDGKRRNVCQSADLIDFHLSMASDTRHHQAASIHMTLSTIK